jgi:hypothetical protein
MAVRAPWCDCSAASDKQCSCKRSCSCERSAEIRVRQRECSEPLSDVSTVTSYVDSRRALLKRKPFKPWPRARVASGCRSCCPMPNYLAPSQIRPHGGIGAFWTSTKAASDPRPSLRCDLGRRISPRLGLRERRRHHAVRWRDRQSSRCRQDIHVPRLPHSLIRSASTASCPACRCTLTRVGAPSLPRSRRKMVRGSRRSST